MSEINIWRSHHALCNRCRYTTRHAVNNFWMSACGREYCLYAQSKFVFWSCKTRISSKTLPNQISRVLNRRHIRRISRPRKKSHVLSWTEVSNSLCNMWACIILLKDSSRDSLKEDNDSGLYTSRTYLLLLRLPSIRTKLDRPWYEITTQNITLGVWPLRHLITHSERQRWPAKHLIRTWPSCSHKLKHDSSEKATWWQSACKALCSWAHCRRSCRWFAVKGILYKGTLARRPRCSRRRQFDEADISTPVAEDQRAANCLEEAVWYSPPWGARLIIVLWCRLPSSTAGFLSCFVFVGPLLPNSHHWGTIPLHTSCCCTIGQSSFQQADNPPQFKLRKL